MFGCTQKDENVSGTGYLQDSTISYIFSPPVNRVLDSSNLSKRLMMGDLNDPCMSGDAYATSYQLNIIGCNSANATFSLNEIIYFGGNIPPPSLTVQINGINFLATFVSSSASTGMHRYKLLNVPLSTIGINNYCSRNASVLVRYASCGIVTPPYQILDFVSLNGCSFSTTCSGIGINSGTIKIIYPVLLCGECSSGFPATLGIRYKKINETTWNYKTVNYPLFFNDILITGLSQGVYEVETKNTCSVQSGPWVDIINTTVSVN